MMRLCFQEWGFTSIVVNSQCGKFTKFVLLGLTKKNHCISTRVKEHGQHSQILNPEKHAKVAVLSELQVEKTSNIYRERSLVGPSNGLLTHA